MKYFAPEQSIVRRIWGKADTILFIFAGASAEFALNKAVDWLYFTGKLPEDPIGRLFSTVSYARKIVFAENDAAEKAIDTITSIHKAVESSRQSTIPDWAYRDVLYMLIHYSIAAFELLERKMNMQEKQEVYDVFYRVGKRMQLKDLPDNYLQWLPDREAHLNNDILRSHFTDDLFVQYKKHLGSFRYTILIESQKTVVPPQVAQLLQLGKMHWLKPVVPVYKATRVIKADQLLMNLLLPAAYKKQILDLNQWP
ncbi:MAG TPA: oxygenase MpaB family protein [Phnomibacter sp.]|nr:oxygenase MpaB family protein [Phnomibacter sp.]